MSNLIAPEPGTINDRILCAVSAIGEHATRDGIHRAVECNDALLAIAIAALVRDGYLTLSDGGHYVVAESLRASYVFNQSPPQPVAAQSAQHETPRGAAMETKVCTGKYSCGTKQPLAAFYEGVSSCKRCILDRQKAVKLAKQQGVVPKKAAKKPAAEKVGAQRAAAPAPAPRKLIIPAIGEVTAERLNGAVVLRQFEHEVILSVQQVPSLMEWLREFNSAA